MNGLLNPNLTLLMHFNKDLTTEEENNPSIQIINKNELSIIPDNHIFGNSSLYFSPTSKGYLRTKTHNVKIINSNNFTIEFWAYFDSIEHRGLIETESDGEYYGWSFWIVALDGEMYPRFTCFGRNGEWITYLSSSITIEPNKWHHFAFTHNNNYIYIHINGTRIGRSSGWSDYDFSSGYSIFEDDVINNNLHLNIGKSSRYNTNFKDLTFNGYLDEFAISDFAKYTSPIIQVPKIELDTVNIGSEIPIYRNISKTFNFEYPNSIIRFPCKKFNFLYYKSLNRYVNKKYTFSYPKSTIRYISKEFNFLHNNSLIRLPAKRYTFSDTPIIRNNTKSFSIIYPYSLKRYINTRFNIFHKSFKRIISKNFLFKFYLRRHFFGHETVNFDTFKIVSSNINIKYSIKRHTLKNININNNIQRITSKCFTDIIHDLKRNSVNIINSINNLNRFVYYKRKFNNSLQRYILHDYKNIKHDLIRLPAKKMNFIYDSCRNITYITKRMIWSHTKRILRPDKGKTNTINLLCIENSSFIKF